MNELSKNDLELVYDIKNDVSSNESIKTLESRHSGICHQMIKKYYHAFIEKGIDPIDISSDKNYVIYQSALNFDPSKNVKFSTWLGNQMRYHCLNCLNARKSSILFMDEKSLKNLIEKNQVRSESIFKEEGDYIFSLIKQLKDKRIEKIFKLRYYADNKKSMSWNFIGKKLKISTQTAINLHNKAVEFLINKYKAKDFIDKI